MRRFCAVLALALCGSASFAAAAGEMEPERHLDLTLTAFAATPERFAFCIAEHLQRSISVDLSIGGDRQVGVLTSHGFYRKRWQFPWSGQTERGLVLSAGAGLGARVTFFCPYSRCGVAAGPEALLSLEAVVWTSSKFGVVLQADGGFAVVWAASAPGVIDASYVFPGRVLAGITF